MPETVTLFIYRCVGCAALFGFFEGEGGKPDRARESCPVCHDRVTFIFRVKGPVSTDQC